MKQAYLFSMSLKTILACFALNILLGTMQDVYVGYTKEISFHPIRNIRQTLPA